MPYIDKRDRRILNQGPKASPLTAGELNFCISILCKEYLDAVGLRYDTINEVIGALECAKLELYRRVAVPYEDKKVAENGDIY